LTNVPPHPRQRKAKRADRPNVQVVSDGIDMFVVVDGLKVAKCGRPNTRQAKTWVPIEPGWEVIDEDYPITFPLDTTGRQFTKRSLGLAPRLRFGIHGLMPPSISVVPGSFVSGDR
jgi:hypothetical protein